MLVEAKNGRKYLRTNVFDPFYIMFLGNKILRPSCYKCNFKGENHCADITIADFWGASKVMPDFGKEGDISLVLVHSEKGLSILKNVSEGAQLRKVNMTSALQGNTMYYQSVKMSKEREVLFDDLQRKSFRKIVKVHGRPKIKSVMLYILDKLSVLSLLRNFKKKLVGHGVKN